MYRKFNTINIFMDYERLRKGEIKTPSNFQLYSIKVHRLQPKVRLCVHHACVIILSTKL